ncbi:hypothetical protein COW36_09870 [bacterium (Candidatus Blackallbacteria) CG17_big_fil_post_rev_8_21_14_2_50_48_46]|uniref:Transglycosylase SLT domain-containing protein n=1 Tax=bacterium (Candidatus Blackallbacteria) CG17_big_fil_post_rev_8_21_14_2_50_48_46 TaxID=2014261 RepID=A0A2M7G5B9_9BACT|nr:MAG: hypothetical protein COW64_26000 [bacterium (Candidatus Blackallbacteria) CG18_big_fil_WC_8_21_14_2_50_49_26]PIW17154.1 MAG: hypothetical protein COW36_09870 [bacterium (Candidatus Blackallbacteria) CG17_big_fil_post_rev_8_21_14_2_50_48_46]PIW49994.1 MAG: hypothetical protein COW20_04000 [bacterium (Candidatus Blackallbacteria) CG13_big_fil_rev_8_21_14_2_50_49_14]
MVDGIRRTGSLAPSTSVRPPSRPVQQGQTLEGPMQMPASSAQLNYSADVNKTGRFAVHGSAATELRFPERSAADPVTKETLMGAIAADNGPGGLASKLSNSKNRATFEKIAETCIKVGEKENVDPRILFAMAMQESDCGLNTKHSSSAQGITGMKPSSAPNRSARTQLGNYEVCLTQTARYLKGQLVRELNAKGHSSVSAADVAPGANNNDTAKLLFSYRFGAGALNQKLRKNTVEGLVRHSDYSNVFRHMNDMGLPRS